MRKMSRQMTVAIAGLGSRGRDTYAKAAKIYPDKMKIVAIADIDPEKVKLTAEEYDVPMSHCYESAEGIALYKVPTGLSGKRERPVNIKTYTC